MAKKMMKNDIEKESELIFQQICQDERLGKFVDCSLKIKIPEVFIGKGQIKLIFLGQDPTVKSKKSRHQIKQVLNLDKNGRLKEYLNDICKKLDLDLEQNIYATNYYKNFFIDPPTTIREVDIFQEFQKYWLPLLRKEINQFPDVPIISLGEPLLNSVVRNGFPMKVRYYWGYTQKWRDGVCRPSNYINFDENNLNRIIFPFPHQPSKDRIPFYQHKFEEYVSFVRNHIGKRTNPSC